MPQDEPAAAVKNGWALFTHELFADRLQELVDEAKRVRREDPEAFPSHPAVKLLGCVLRAIEEVVPQDPSHRAFLQGKTLGKGLAHWRRVKKFLPERYRLFFRYGSAAPKTIIYAWLNDELTLRKAGSKTDCYAVFEALVRSGKVPDNFDELRAAAEPLTSAS